MTGVTCGFDHFNLLLRARTHAAHSARAERSVVHVASVKDWSTNLRPSTVRPSQDGRGKTDGVRAGQRGAPPRSTTFVPLILAVAVDFLEDLASGTSIPLSKKRLASLTRRVTKPLRNPLPTRRLWGAWVS